MLEILKFIFSDLWIFIGFVILCDVIGGALGHVIAHYRQVPADPNYVRALKLIRDADVPDHLRNDFTEFAQVKAKRALDGEEIIGSW